MIPHRLPIIVWFVLVLLAGRAVDGKAETLPRSADQAIDHTYDTRLYWMGQIEQDTTWRDTAPADAAKPATPAGTERKEDLELSHPRETKITPPMNQPFEIQEITIYGGHKEVVLALLEAVDEGTPVTGIAGLDSLAATYGLIGIYRTGRRSSGLYGYRFGLTFPPGADVAAIAKAYRNLSYIQSIKSGDSLTMKGMRPSFNIENGGLRLLAKVAAGTGSGMAVTALAVGVLDQIYEPLSAPDANADRGLGFLLAGAAIGCSVGFPFGVSSIDPYDSLPKTLLAGVIPGAVGFSALLQADVGIGFLFAYVVPVISSSIMSELSRQLPQDRRISFALSPTLNGGLSAVTTLRF